MSLARYYAWLSWFQDAARLVGHDTGQHSLTVHRLLAAPDGAVSGDVLHARVLDAATAPSEPTASAAIVAVADRRSPSPSGPVVLDAGCGLGGTTFFLQARLGGSFHGITLSPAQCARATREASRRGLSDVCTFAVRSYDDPLADLLPDAADLVVAIESLAHASDPGASVARLAALVRPGGRMIVVDDMPESGLAANDPDFAAFRRGWACPVVASADAILSRWHAAGLRLARDEDLTPLMRPRHPRSLARLTRLNERANVVLRFTPARVLLASLHGGLMLERLYQRRQMRYRLLAATRPPSADAS